MPIKRRFAQISISTAILVTFFLSASSSVSGKSNDAENNLTPEVISEIDPTYEWGTYIYTNEYDVSQGVVTDDTGSAFILSNSFDSEIPDGFAPNDDPNQILVSKISENGILEWQVTLESGLTSVANAIAIDGKGNIYVAGRSDETWGNPLVPFSSEIFSNAFVAKLDPNGSLLWSTFINSSIGFSADSIATTENGDLYMAGDVFTRDANDEPGAGTWVPQLGKLNSDGKVEWINAFTEFQTISSLTGDDIFFYHYIVKTDLKGLAYVAGYVDRAWGEPIRNFSGPTDIFVAAFDNTGNLIWNSFLGIEGSATYAGPQLNDFQIDHNGGLYIAGVTEKSWGDPIRPYTGEIDAFLAKMNSSGNLLWNTFIGGNGDYDYIHSIIIGQENNPYIIGASESTWGEPLQPHDEKNECGSYGAFIAQFDASGLLLWNTFIEGGGNYAAEAKDASFYLVSDQSYIYCHEPEIIDFGNDDNDVYISKLNLYETLVTYRGPGPFIPEITRYIPTPMDISRDPQVIWNNVLVAILLMLPFAMAVDIATRLFTKNEATLVDRFAPIAMLQDAQERYRNLITRMFGTRRRLREFLGALSVIFFYGIAFSLLEPSWNPFTFKGVFLLVSMMVAYGMVGILDDLVQWRMIRKWHASAEFSVRSANLFMVITSLGASRLLALLPGLMFGAPEAIHIDEEKLTKRQSQTLTRISMLTYVTICAVAWLSTIFTYLYLAVQSEQTGLALDVVGGLQAMLLIIFAVALENTFIQMLGISEGLGKRIKRDNRWFWMIGVVLCTFAFLHTLLNPRYTFIESLQKGNTTIFIEVAAAFILITFTAQFIIGWRRRRTPNKE